MTDGPALKNEDADLLMTAMGVAAGRLLAEWTDGDAVFGERFLEAMDAAVDYWGKRQD